MTKKKKKLKKKNSSSKKTFKNKEELVIKVTKQWAKKAYVDKNG